MSTDPLYSAESEVIDRLYAAIARGDSRAARECCTSDALFWHCFDGVAQDLDAAGQGWSNLRAVFSEMWLQDVRRSRAGDGRFVSQQIFAGRRTDGTTIGWAVCLLVEIRDGLIARIDEYIDRGGVFPIDSRSSRTPGLPHVGARH